jgi:hypothetical protein
MKKVLILIMTLLAMFAVSPVMAPATKTPVTGFYIGSATRPGQSWITKDNILHIKNAEGFGPVIGDLPGDMWFTLSGAIDLNTGFGSMHGRWVFTDDSGTFEGSYRADNWGVVYYEGSAIAQGTGGYEGQVYKVTSFWGFNLYLGGYEGPDGVQFDFVGTILDPHDE